MGIIQSSPNNLSLVGIKCSLTEKLHSSSHECVRWKVHLSKTFCTMYLSSLQMGIKYHAVRGWPSKPMKATTPRNCKAKDELRSSPGGTRSSRQLSLLLLAKYPQHVWAAGSQIFSYSTGPYLRRGGTAISFHHYSQLQAVAVSLLELMVSLMAWCLFGLSFPCFLSHYSCEVPANCKWLWVLAKCGSSFNLTQLEKFALGLVLIHFTKYPLATSTSSSFWGRARWVLLQLTKPLFQSSG